MQLRSPLPLRPSNASANGAGGEWGGNASGSASVGSDPTRVDVQHYGMSVQRRRSACEQRRLGGVEGEFPSSTKYQHTNVPLRRRASLTGVQLLRKA